MIFVSEPRIHPNPNSHVPLAAVVEFTTDRPSRAVLSVSGQGRRWRVDTGTELITTHRIAVVGLRSGEDCSVDVTVLADGCSLSAPSPLVFETPVLADDFPPMQVLNCHPEKREPGSVMFNVRYAPSSAHLPGMGLLAVVDRFGEVIWTYHSDEPIGDARRLANGNILFVCEGRIIEIDWLGDPVSIWYSKRNWRGTDLPSDAIPVDAEMFHHAAIELPSGNILACSIELRSIENFPGSEVDPAAAGETATVVGDVIIEFRPDGTVENRYRLFDILDPFRICYDSRDDFWGRRGYPDTCDWSHLNGLAYHAGNDLIVASLRHQDCLIGINRRSGELVWILGNHDNWHPPWSDKLLTPAEGLEWPYHQHDCSFTSSDTILCFDNGNHRAEPFAPKKPDSENYSRVVEFKIDTDKHSVREIWKRGKEEDGTFSVFQSGACLLPSTGNVFINYGGICTSEGVPTTDVVNSRCEMRLIEVTRACPQEVVFEMIVKDESPDRPCALSSFRGEHFPGFGEPTD